MNTEAMTATSHTADPWKVTQPRAGAKFRVVDASGSIVAVVDAQRFDAAKRMVDAINLQPAVEQARAALRDAAETAEAAADACNDDGETGRFNSAAAYYREALRALGG